MRKDHVDCVPGKVYFGPNLLSGTLPSEYGNMKSLLQLDLDGNPLLSGSIPMEWANLENLGYLAISGSSGLSGVIPEEICYLQSPNCSMEVWYATLPCYLSFDCSDLCGCDCACPFDDSGNASSILLGSQNETPANNGTTRL